ncbi:hypothetical protein [Pseudoponticoccus marisrubri]|uniref:Lysozyme inhibitor LprI N-terminal domain-containing protein n=1 Tax=Pseudoponticoccus marisrubri TaxID=1685382 RepID=A0A0W7WPF8_9RHOB|nr:hypothetical protein [Pseudoponticoccus marisrubri]KUF12454.1 hypothetical protein AVJ23_01610 [Pseudoponticoccus marisrubri]
MTYRILAAVLPALLAAAPGLAQGRLCLDAPDGSGCRACLQNFAGDSADERRMRAFMCYGGEALPEPEEETAAAPAPEGICDFSACPEDVASYRACVEHGATIARTTQVEEIGAAYAALIVREIPVICAEDGMPAIKAQLDGLVPQYGALTSAQRDRFNGCIDAQVAARDELIARFDAEGVQSGLSVLSKRRAEDEIRELYRLQGFASVMGLFEIGTTLSDYAQRVAADMQVCETEGS